MIVLDTSAAVELLLSLPLSPAVRDHLSEADWQIAAPELLTVEVLQVLRRRVASGAATLEEADVARSILVALNIRYYDHVSVVDRIWDLRDNLTAYDACFVALAELLDAELVTCDPRLARAPGNDARVTLLE